MSDKLKIKTSSSDEWIELFPYNLALGLNELRPIMIFKDKSESFVLPVNVGMMDANLLAEGCFQPTLNTPHVIALEVFKKLDITLKKCLFKDVVGHRQIVDLYFEGLDTLKTLEFKAEMVMSFCLQSNVKFYSNIATIKKSQLMTSELENKTQSMDQFSGPNTPTTVPYLN